MGSGNERGSIAISLKSTDLTKGFVAASDLEERCKLQVNVLQIVPWYIKVHYHTLQLLVDEKPQVVTAFVERISVSPSEDKVSLGMMELILMLPCDIKSAVLNIEFDKVCSNSYFLLYFFCFWIFISLFVRLTNSFKLMLSNNCRNLNSKIITN